MDIATLKAVLMWCTVINAVLLIYTFLITAYAGDWIYRMHSKWYPMSRETFNVAIYGFIGMYKIIFLVFILVPYIALLIVG